MCTMRHLKVPGIVCLFAYVLNYIVSCYFTGARFREGVVVETRAIFYAVSLPVH